MREFRNQFHGPAIEEIHEKKMRELKMNNDATMVYFQKLKREASLAGRREDTGP